MANPEEQLTKGIGFVFEAVSALIAAEVRRQIERSTAPEPQPTVEPLIWMSVAEVAAYARLGRTELLEALGDESLRGYQRRPGGRWRIHRDDVDAWLRGLPAVSAPEPITSRRKA